jgi:predicted adenylyl cyclase CyaB
VSIETEIKIHLADRGAFRRHLISLNPVPISSRHFEDNFLLDYPDRRIQREGCLLRVRRAGNKSLLTFKGSPQANNLFKIREELEIAIESGDTILMMFEKLGMQVWFRYQKYREEFALVAGERADESVHVAIDETPVGNYSEIEGCEPGIREVADAMGFGESQYLRASYYSLYLQHCRERGFEPAHMVFPCDRADNSGKDRLCQSLI